MNASCFTKYTKDEASTAFVSSINYVWWSAIYLKQAAKALRWPIGSVGQIICQIIPTLVIKLFRKCSYNLLLEKTRSTIMQSDQQIPTLMRKEARFPDCDEDRNIWTLLALMWSIFLARFYRHNHNNTGNKTSVSTPVVYLRANLQGNLESTAKVVVVRSSDNILWQKSPTIACLEPPGCSLNTPQKYDETLARYNEPRSIGAWSWL